MVAVVAVFHATKRFFAREKDWYTSIGYDLCPACRRIEHKEAVFEDSGDDVPAVIVPFKERKDSDERKGI